MKFQRFFILAAAALLGSVVYKAQRMLTEPGTSAIPGQDIYSSVTGPGSLGETFREGKEARAAALQRGEYSGQNDGNTDAASDTSSPYYHPSPYGRRRSPFDQQGNQQEVSTDDMLLIQAAAKGDDKRVESRLSSGAKVDSRDNKRRTPLMYASWNGYEDVCSRLLAAGANPQFKDRAGNNVFDYAAGRGLIDTLNFLLQRTHTTDDQHYMEYAMIIKATFAGDPSQLPPDNGKLASVNRINPEDHAPLHIAAGNGSIDLMKELIRRGAQVDIANDNRQTALQWAAWNNQTQAAALLLDQGADIGLADLAGNTPLILAAQNGSTEAAQLLLSRGADRYVANKNGKTAAIIAADAGNSGLATLLK